MELHLAAVSFLNTVPLVELFNRADYSDVRLTRALPSELSAMLTSGYADVGLLPVVEVLRGNSAGILPGACIGCKGPVDSVKFFVSGELKDLKMVKADRGSRSSVALLKILLAEKWGITPCFQETKPEPGTSPAAGHGILVIGDRCFQYEKALVGNPSVSCFDLGQMWYDLTGLPFVFAVWAAAPAWVEKSGQAKVEQAKAMLKQAMEFGLSILPELSDREAKAGRIGLNGEATTAAIDYYFRYSLNYRLENSSMQGIREFHRLCLQHNLISGGSFPPIL